MIFGMGIVERGGDFERDEGVEERNCRAEEVAVGEAEE